ncbi:MAG: hypothetical protein CUN49_09625 [Candidatus Thermofonsia Clade 1 bacterium]|jgi:hypothetical protein|uniref:STAS/SEC14 domain-containing protein n=1 Tax=Candidatus Thermofonsia Clade 1 bacterium TaxID=2364210 RepID=A0A2M8PDJ7_9CHLR|nr:MAG: hypothetical protein CUN49_09625 [Candidatus Thermofonsia Clade 1 bacterium]PJF42424.1 MAG: hypothetical protein CUN50_04240 [Candidatus Thermofonsia Clade 1 bacterium]RMF51070.1 MAG: hypothetical protein D6749_08865 [Chloroflexota bacterium]
MPITQKFEANGRIVCVKMADPWTVDEMLAAFKEAERHLEAATKPIHMLVDMREAVRTTHGALRAREAPVLRHPMGGEIAVFGINLAGRILAETVLRLARFQRAHFFETEAEARAYLNKLIAEEAQV